MGAKVFVSCGQNSDAEKSTAKEIALFLTRKGFSPYVAAELYSIPDLNRAIIGELKSSDYFIFINFRREIIEIGGSHFYRGSIFANQELAIAYSLEFEYLICLNQTRVLREGIFHFIGGHAPEFETHSEIMPLIETGTHDWLPSYSRQLHLVNLRWSRDVTYHDNSSEIITDFSPGKRLANRRQRMLLATVRNDRVGKNASGTIARLATIRHGETEILAPSPDRSQLKASGIPGYTHVIWPQSEESFDLLAIHLDCPREIFLNSNHDFDWRAPIINQIGFYTLQYEIFSDGFPMLSFSIHLHVSEVADATVAEASNNLIAYKDPIIAVGLQGGPWSS